MKMIIAFAALVAVALAAPQGKPEDVYVVRQVESDNIGTGPYKFSYQLSNGASRQESAEYKNEGTDQQVLVVKGSYTAFDPETQQEFTVNYISDENGFQPTGDHIPV